MFFPAGAWALAETVLRAVGRGEELTLKDIVERVRDDYGSVTERSVSRHLATLVRFGFLIKAGPVTPHEYSRPRC